MKTLTRFSFFLFLLLCLPSATAQTEFGETLKSRIYVGGTFSLQFGTMTNFDVSPLAGYNFTRHLSAGVGLTYIFNSYRDPYQSYRAHFFGGRVFTRIVPLPDLLPAFFIHGEYETINNERYVLENSTSGYVLKRTWTPALLAGIGFRQQAGNNSYFTISLLYNISDDGSTTANTIYAGPIIPRIGFVYGFY